jgi:PST family polysaccharide transporter/lipopolysaccharide exporter
MSGEHRVSREELREATLAGVRWITAARIAFEAVAVAGAIVLAHLIPPAAFGSFAIVLILPELALSLVNEGLGTPIVQRRELSRRHLEGAVAVGLAGGLILTALTYFLVPLVSDPLFGKEATELFRLYSPVFTVAAVMIVPLAMLQRRLEFRRMGMSEVVSIGVTTATSLTLALLGLDAKALVLGSLAGIAAWALTLFLFASSPRPRWHRREIREIAEVGAPAAGAGLAGIGNRNVDYIILGTQFAAAKVGFYYRAFTLGVEYERKISGIVTRIAFPVYSRTEDLDHMRSVRRRIVRLNATLIFPLLAFFVVVAPVLVPWLFGARWSPAVLPAQILAVAGMAVMVKNTVDPLILAAGRPRALLAFNFCELAVYAAVLVLAASGGSLVVVCAAVAAFRVVALLASYRFLLGRVAGISVRELIGDAGPALAGCLALLGVAFPVRAAIDMATVPTLAVCGLAAGAAYVAALRLISPAAWGDVLLIVRAIRPSRNREQNGEQPSGDLSAGLPHAQPLVE